MKHEILEYLLFPVVVSSMMVKPWYGSESKDNNGLSMLFHVNTVYCEE